MTICVLFILYGTKEQYLERKWKTLLFLNVDDCGLFWKGLVNEMHSPCWSLGKRTSHFLSAEDKLNYRCRRRTIQASPWSCTSAIKRGGLESHSKPSIGTVTCQVYIVFFPFLFLGNIFAFFEICIDVSSRGLLPHYSLDIMSTSLFLYWIKKNRLYKDVRFIVSIILSQYPNWVCIRVNFN